MAYISPNSNIWILKGVPLDDKHTKSYRPKSKAEQFEQFTAFTAYTLTNQSYIRHSNNSIRVELQADNVINCNYMLFQNNSFGDKIFYAFITDVEYVSNSTCRIEYKIDVLQTYYFDIDFLPSMIEREHSKTDAIGDSVTADYYIGKNIVCNTNRIIGADTISIDDLEDFVVVIVTTKMLDDPTSPLIRQYYTTGNLTGYMRSNCVSFIRIGGLSEAEVKDVDTLLNNYIANNGDGINGIVDIYCVPQIFIHDYIFSGSYVVNVSDKITRIDVPVETIGNGSALDGYTPKNKKLLTSPYVYGVITAPTGQTRNISYELWDSTYDSHNDIYFSTMTMEASILAGVADYRVTPKNYGGYDYTQTNSLTVQNFPQVPINIDAFTNWSSQNKNSFLASTISLGISAVTNALTLNAAGMMGDATTSMGMVANNADLKNQTVGVNSASTSTAIWAYPDHYYRIATMSIDADSARQVDDYFTKYGYSVGRLKIPNFWSGAGRTNYNYCKTSEANIRSINPRTTGLPSDALSEICDIFNNGVCLWESLGSVGNYGDNPCREE